MIPKDCSLTNFETHSPDETIALAERLGAKLEAGAIILYKGGLAAGKTTFSKGIGLALGIEEPITSPTFTVISEYDGKMPLYHFDLYRLSGSYEFEMLGVDDMLFGQGVCLIEWSEHAEEVLPDEAIGKVITVSIEISGPSSRRISISGIDL